ncbi:SRSO17 transposase [Actinopolyspora biskrensis]|uniref:SRSO17 transposase n=1 Tax=Actinopolyspora biskrensis TaxID=1470178 RepID=A0A852Z5D4_9ACTN|nr:SRSO17 transposase [Actinopolyspora biskrensis]
MRPTDKDRLSEQPWRRSSVGTGAHGPRIYDWARVPLGTHLPPRRGHWPLARHSISNLSEIACYICYGPRRTRLLNLVWTAGSRWHVEECFQQAENEAGLDHYQARSRRAWYAHTTLSLLALAWLTVTKKHATKVEVQQH